MITVANRIPVHPDHAEAFENAFAQRLGLVDGMKGYLAFRLLRPTKAEDPYVVLTFWETQEDFRAWTQSKEFKEQHKKSRMLGSEAFTGTAKIEVHEIVQESGARLQAWAPLDRATEPATRFM